MRRLWVAMILMAAAGNSFAVENITGTTGFQIVARLTGATSINHTNTVNIGGTDLGHTVNHNGKTYFLFGDTFSGETPAIGGSWRHNVMSWSTDTNPADGIIFDDWLKTGSAAKEVITSGVGSPITEIPTGAISVNGNIYAWYMAVNNWGPPGQWTLDRAGLAKWSEGQTAFTNISGFSLAGNSNFGMVAAVQRSAQEPVADDNVYLWGTPSGRFGSVKLARVAPAQIENLSAYQYYAGSVADVPLWVGNESAAATIVPSAVGEMSVMYNEAVGAWTMMYFDDLDDRFKIRQSPTPWGSWSSPITVATSAQAPGGLYAPYMNSQWVQDGGRTVYFTMSLWDSYDVYLAKTTLIIPEPAGVGVVMMFLGLAVRRRR
jgi:hypothetical protein